MKRRFISWLVVIALSIAMLPSVIPTVVAAESWFWPVDGVYVMSRGYYSGHYGIDIAASLGTTVRATKSGTVIQSSNSCPHTNYGTGCSCNGGCGNFVKIQHDDGTYSRYLHLTQGTAIAVGTYVHQGDTVGKSGSSGDSTGPHLHFECYNTSNQRINNNPTDPRHTYYGSHEGTGISYIYVVGDSSTPGKPALKNFSHTYSSGATITFLWDSTANTTHYNLYIDKRNSDGSYQTDYKVWHYASSGMTTTLPDGAYRVLLQSTNSNAPGADGTGWAYTNADYVEFVVGFHTHDKSEYMFYEAAHPHCNCYKCSVCGEIWRDASSSNFIDSCDSCHWVVGEDFYAYIIKDNSWKNLEANQENNVQLAANGNDCYDPKQVWHFMHQGNGLYKIQNEYNGNCLDAANYGTTNGTNVQTCPDNGGTAQRWYLCAKGNGYSLIPSYCTSLSIDITGNSDESGTNAILYGSHNGTAQIFTIYNLLNDGLSYSKPGKPQRTTISIASLGTAGKTTTFSWTKSAVTSNPFDDCHYDVRIWTGDNYNTLYHAEWGLSGNSYSIVLPEGKYQVSIYSVNYKYYNWNTYGNSVNFEVQHTHSYNSEVIPPSCTEQGYTVHTCTICGYSYKDNYTNALGHNYTYSVTNAPTTSATGMLTGTCSRCSTVNTVTLPKLNNADYNYSVIAAPSCTSTGTGRYTWKTTTYGSFYFDVTIPKTAHNYQDTVTAPTCTTQGYTTHTCSACGDTYKDTYTNALGHAWDAGVVTTQPTATEPGVKTFTCTSCGVTRTEAIPATGFVNPFVDVKEKDYFFNAVMWAVQNGITSGTSATTFSPKDGCTRAQVVTFLWRSAGSPEPTSTNNPFADVKAGKYYYKAVMWAVQNGITSGTSQTKFSPDDTCTRAQIVTFLWRAAGSPDPTATNNPFADVKAGKYYYKAVMWAVEKKVTAGTSAITFSPDNTCTRAQVVTFLYRDMVG